MTPPVTVPLIPDADEARGWAEQELADPVYQAAEPTAFDRFARDVGDFLASLLSSDLSPAAAPWLTALVLAAVVGAVVLAVVIWGRPRRLARSTASATLFGATETRSAAELRGAAEAAAADAQWPEAIALRFRALARGLVERTVLDPEPGATVHRFARQAAVAFPAERAALDHAADLFDDVRYLRRPGTVEAYRTVVALDERLAATTPAVVSA